MGFDKKPTDSFIQNHGVRGVIYILENPGLRDGYFKIGCSRRSGASRANRLNIDANTGTPGSFRCIFECHTEDCGLAEQRVFEVLKTLRRGKWGQEFFQVNVEFAKETILRVCGQVDAEVTERIAKEQRAAANRDKPATQSWRIRADAPPSYHPTAKPYKNRSSFTRWTVIAGILAVIIWWTQKDDKGAQHPAPVGKPKVSARNPGSTAGKTRAQRELSANVPRLEAASELPKNSATKQPAPTSISAPRAEVNSYPMAPEPTPMEFADDPGGKQVETPVNAMPVPDLSRIPADEVEMINRACEATRASGPEAHTQCVSNQIEALVKAPPFPPLLNMTATEIDKIRRACRSAREAGPADYRKCLVNHTETSKRSTITQPSRR